MGGAAWTAPLWLTVYFFALFLSALQAPAPVQYQQMPVAQPVYQQAQPVYQQQQPVYQQQPGITFQPAPQTVFVQQPPQVSQQHAWPCHLRVERGMWFALLLLLISD